MAAVCAATQPTFAEDFRVGVSTGFYPPLVRVEPGDSVTWRWSSWNGGASVTSGEPCTPDGLFEINITGGPWGPYEGTWEVPLDTKLTEVPYFNGNACKDMTATIRVIDVREVPAEYPTIQDAINAANPYDTISISAGTYYESDLVLTKNFIRIEGELDDESNPLVMVGPKSGGSSTNSILSIDSIDGVEIIGIHFTGNETPTTSGGGLSITSCNPVIQNCFFTHNAGVNGGGFFATDSDVSISNCTFEGNSAHNGAGAYFNASTAVLTGCVFKGNSADSNDGIGGGISAYSSTLDLNDCWLSENTAITSAGGMYIDASPTSIFDSLFCANQPNAIVGEWTNVGGVAFEDICPVYNNVLHIVSVVDGAFVPDIVNVQPGDSIRWPLEVSSGENCTPDGRFVFDNVGGGPGGGAPWAQWQVPLDVGFVEIPYFNPNACEAGLSGGIRIINVHEVPAEFSTVAEGVNAAQEHDIVSIAAGRYYESGLNITVENILFRGEVDADGHPLAIIGPESGTVSSPSIMTINGVEGIVVEGIHFTGSRATTGGGLNILSCSPVVKNCFFTNNMALSGGGISFTGGDLSVERCRFEENSANIGAGAYLNQGTVTLTDCTFVGNEAQEGMGEDGSGGGIAIRSADVDMDDSFMTGNTATGAGGGISASDSTLDISGSEIRENEASIAGGIFIENTTTSIDTTRVCGNSPDQIVGPWTNDGNAAVRDSCSSIYVPEDFLVLQDAIDSSNEGDTIFVSAGTYSGGSDSDINIEGKAISIIGETNEDGTPAVIIQGVFVVGYVHTGEVQLQNVQMNTTYLLDCYADLSNCVVQYGGGQIAGLLISNFEGTINDCRIANNYAQFFTGGLMLWDQLEDAQIASSNVTFLRCVVENNSGTGPFGSGGNSGVSLQGGIVHFEGCTIQNNTASNAGLSISSDTTTSLRNTLVCGNTNPGQISGQWTDQGGNYIADTCPDCPGDFDGNDEVNGSDLGLLLSAWGTSNPLFDLDQSGLVSGGDIGLMLSYWGSCQP